MKENSSSWSYFFFFYSSIVSIINSTLSSLLIWECGNMSNKSLMAKKHTARVLGLLNISDFFTDWNMFGVLLWFVFPTETNQQSEKKKRGGGADFHARAHLFLCSALLLLPIIFSFYGFLLILGVNRWVWSARVITNACVCVCVCAQLFDITLFRPFFKEGINSSRTLLWRLRKEHCHLG